MLNKTLFPCLTLLFMVMTAVPAKAETVLFFAPTRVEIMDKSPVQEIRVTNMSGIARSYQLSIENLMMGADGVTMRVDNFNYSAKRMLRFVPRQFDLKPGAKQIIRIMARFPEGTEDGEYHSHIQFLENVSKRVELNKDVAPENRARMNAQISYSMAVPVIISKGDVKTDIAMNNLAFTQDSEGHPQISLSLTRAGNGQGNIFLEADYIAADGSEVKAAVRRSVYVYRELDTREHSFKLELIDQKDLQKGGQIRVKIYNRDMSEQEPVDTVFVPVS